MIYPQTYLHHTNFLQRCYSISRLISRYRPKFRHCKRPVREPVEQHALQPARPAGHHELLLCLICPHQKDNLKALPPVGDNPILMSIGYPFLITCLPLSARPPIFFHYIRKQTNFQYFLNADIQFSRIYACYRCGKFESNVKY